jgi:hypothetical protein
LLAFPAFQRLSLWITRLYTAFTADGSGRLWPRPLDTDDGNRNAGLIADMDEYITIATFDKTIDAHIAMGRLAAEGVRAQLFDDNMVQMDWLYAIALGGIKLRVTRADESRARRILATDYSHELDDVDVGKPES